MRFDEKARENLEAAERLLPDEDGVMDALANASATRAYYAAYLTVADAAHLASLLGGRPVQWAPAQRLVGDYEGRQRTVEVFDASAGEQRELLRAIRRLRAEIERLVGGPLIVIFHTPEESERLYPTVAVGRRNRELAALVTAWMATDSPDEPPYDPDKIERLTLEAA